MPDLSDAASKALPYWGIIERAATEHWTTATLWDAIRSQAADWQLTTPGVGAAGVSTLRGMAGGIAANASRFDDLADARIIRASHISQTPWSRSLGEQRGNSRYQIRFLHTTEHEGQITTSWRTSMYQGSLPRTAGELRDSIEQDAIQIANKYGFTHVGMSDIQILAV